ncbi:MAG TPA: hypothetical protein VLL31_00080 [Sulfurovum sp.]|nr:hypothetical protein [Sulfurovum sp.]
MQKILMISAIAATLMYAQEMSIEEELASQKTKPKATQNDYMPNISLILDASYTKESLDIDTEHVEIPSFVHGGGHDEHAHTPLVGNDGFNLNYAELVMSSSVDNYFDLIGVFHMTEDDIEIEEGYVVTTSLPYHLRAKIGKFRSDFGYLSNKHEHAYSFQKLPLIYNALLGDHAINEEGLQLQYVLPTDIYTMAGVELLRGENEQSFGVEGFTPPDLSTVEEPSQPSLVVGYLKTSFDIGGSTILGGVSIAKGDSRTNYLDEEEEAYAFAGDTTIYGMDLVYKNYFSATQSITWQSEYLYREMDGTQYSPEESVWGVSALNKKQAGYYTQLVYQHDRYIKTGVRYSAISKNDITLDAQDEDVPDDISVLSAMAEYNFSEFSRVRLQYNHDASLYTEDEIKNNKDEFIVQFTYAIGAHGAHPF